MKIELKYGDITLSKCDAIVNAANSRLQAGSGVCGAIFDAAGYDKLQDECNNIGYCKTGSACITLGYNLLAKYVIHAVGPIYLNDEVSEPLLKGAYKKSLEIADKYSLKSIAFPAISTGVYGYPLEKGIRIALKTFKEFNNENESKIDIVYLYCYNKNQYDTYKKIFKEEII
ncbi:MAG: macro domain-containing protein [Acholeplasmatales bacterium]|nr:macro domain-containing protein [Acholeplasmatales bacterium]